MLCGPWCAARQGAREPSAAILDIQTVKVTEVSGPRVYDGGKKITGPKRFVLVATLGLLLEVRVLSADVSESAGGIRLLRSLRGFLPRLQLHYVDQDYQGTVFAAAAQETHACRVEVVSPQPGQRGFVVQKKRWIVERSFAWLCRNHRLSKDDELCLVIQRYASLSCVHSSHDQQIGALLIIL